MPILSMTGFGRGRAAEGAVSVTCDIRTVNNRFFDLNPRVPAVFMPLENRIREMVAARLARGRVDLFLSVREPASETHAPKIDAKLAARLLRQVKSLQKELGLSDEIDTAFVLSQPGVLVAEEVGRDIDRSWPLIEKAADKALTALIRMRKKEGAALARELKTQIGGLQAAVKKFESAIPWP
ncbi:MAG: hypothetical protein M5R36_22105 [Deltaproteobacteria bacterium]|nr:hypothetical protein [Deltaproteobacteria bacterium]